MTAIIRSHSPRVITVLQSLLAVAGLVAPPAVLVSPAAVFVGVVERAAVPLQTPFMVMTGVFSGTFGAVGAGGVVAAGPVGAPAAGAVGAVSPCCDCGCGAAWAGGAVVGVDGSGAFWLGVAGAVCDGDIGWLVAGELTCATAQALITEITNSRRNTMQGQPLSPVHASTGDLRRRAVIPVSRPRKMAASWPRSEERRVGKECRSRWWSYH